MTGRPDPYIPAHPFVARIMLMCVRVLVRVGVVEMDDDARKQTGRAGRLAMIDDD